MFVGHESKRPVNEKTIMILGPTGAGKSTLVDGMINYIFGVSWRDRFRLTVEHLEAEENISKGNQALSQTVWITCYTIHPMKGIRIPFKLTIIDTPGYGDVRGIEADKAITEQIRQLFTAKDKKGVVSLDAVCFVIKAPDARLTKTQDYIFKSILSIFQKDIIDNFCMMLTFADGRRPKVLAALKAADLPQEPFFTFNNSALFADNSEDDQRTMLDWEMGFKGFVDFFDTIDKLPSKSLTLSKEVLNERKRIEITIENMQLKLANALNKSQCLTNLVGQMTDKEMKAELYKNYNYQVPEQKVESKGCKVSNLNCKSCKYTCHQGCWAWNLDWCKSMCDVFTSNSCTQCEKKCKAESHVNEKFVWVYTTELVTKTYSDIKKKYDDATQEKLDHKGMIEKMEQELKVLETDIVAMIAVIIKSNKRLKEIALRDDPLSMEDQFDIWIKEEEYNKTEGWLQRVESYKRIKKNAGLLKFTIDAHTQSEKSVAGAQETGQLTKLFSKFGSK